MLRWAVLGVYCASAFSLNLNALAFAAIAKKAAVFYGVSYNAINQITLVGMLLPFAGYPPAMWLADTHRFELPFGISMLVCVALFWLRVYAGADPTQLAFAVVMVVQALSALVSPLLSCLAPALSAKYFPEQERGLATSLGTIASLLGQGGGMVIAPIFENDIPGLLELHAICLSISLGCSLFCLDLCFFCDGNAAPGEPLQRTTSIRRLMRSISSFSVPSDHGFSPLRPEEHHLWSPFAALPVGGGRKPLGHAHAALALPFVFNNFANAPVQPDDAPVPAPRRQSVADSEADALFLPSDEEDDDFVPYHLLSVHKSVTFRTALYLCCTDRTFLLLLSSIGLLCGVVNSWLTLINETAPPAVDNAEGVQLVSLLFFGCGLLGALAMGYLIDITGDLQLVGRCSCALSSPATVLAMLGWRYDLANCMYAGMALVGLFSFGLLPLCIEYGIRIMEQTTDGRVASSFSGTIAGIVQCTTNITGILITMLTTPGNLGIPREDIPLVWLGLIGVGVLCFFALPPTPRLAR